jgi:hypothetical protein
MVLFRIDFNLYCGFKLWLPEQLALI